MPLITVDHTNFRDFMAYQPQTPAWSEAIREASDFTRSFIQKKVLTPTYMKMYEDFALSNVMVLAGSITWKPFNWSLRHRDPTTNRTADASKQLRIIPARPERQTKTLTSGVDVDLAASMNEYDIGDVDHWIVGRDHNSRQHHFGCVRRTVEKSDHIPPYWANKYYMHDVDHEDAVEYGRPRQSMTYVMLNPESIRPEDPTLATQVHQVINTIYAATSFRECIDEILTGFDMHHCMVLYDHVDVWVPPSAVWASVNKIIYWNEGCTPTIGTAARFLKLLYNGWGMVHGDSVTMTAFEESLDIAARSSMDRNFANLGYKRVCDRIRAGTLFYSKKETLMLNDLQWSYNRLTLMASDEVDHAMKHILTQSHTGSMLNDKAHVS